MALTGKKKEAADAIAAANPTWSRKHVEMCAEFLMPTSSAWCFEQGTRQREAAEQLFKERMHAFLVEMNIIPADAAYVRPPDWTSPYTNPTPRAHRQSRVSTPRPATGGAAAETRSTGELKAPTPGTTVGRIWATCDALKSELGRAPTSAEVKADPRVAGVNESTIGTQFSKWRRFNEGKN